MKQLSSSRSRYQPSANCGIANGYYSLKALVGAIVRENAPAVLEIDGCGALSAAELGLAAGDNPGRMRSEASLAMLCGASPIEASSAARRSGIGSTGAETVGPTVRCTASS